jgi:hypothetical protein
MPRHQNGAVALQWLLLGAHKSYTVFVNSYSNAVKAMLEIICEGKTIVLDTAMFVACWISTASAEFLSQKHIGNISDL